jgi:hypothetical protein
MSSNWMFIARECEKHGIQADTSSPFSTPFTKQIKMGMEYADAAKNPFQPKQIITIAETVIFNTGMLFFEELVKKWQAKPDD